ncbi:MAG: T9SS type A sorting domain-containing protein, partial [Mariniphaga sp.]|nr:T9SS type A sorting domain-containing protein [Mariniphaga sp.]
DEDGNIVLYEDNPINIQEFPSPISIQGFIIYPNPAQNQITIALDLDKIYELEGLTAKVFSSSGSCITEFPVYNFMETINTELLPPGIYSILLQNSEKTLGSGKFIIAR